MTSPRTVLVNGRLRKAVVEVSWVCPYCSKEEKYEYDANFHLGMFHIREEKFFSPISRGLHLKKRPQKAFTTYMVDAVPLKKEQEK